MAARSIPGDIRGKLLLWLRENDFDLSEIHENACVRIDGQQIRVATFALDPNGAPTRDVFSGSYWSHVMERPVTVQPPPELREYLTLEAAVQTWPLAAGSPASGLYGATIAVLDNGEVVVVGDTGRWALPAQQAVELAGMIYQVNGYSPSGEST